MVIETDGNLIAEYFMEYKKTEKLRLIIDYIRPLIWVGSIQSKVNVTEYKIAYHRKQSV